MNHGRHEEALRDARAAASKLVRVKLQVGWYAGGG